MNILLPYRFKKVGVIIAPIGLLLWVCMQKGFITRLLILVFGDGSGTQASPPFYIINVSIAILSFFSFLGGIYLITFSKEKIEDERVQRIRLDSFQFAALIQIICMIIGFIMMLLFQEPGEGGLIIFFLCIISIFWLCFIGRFNYKMHTKIK